MPQQSLQHATTPNDDDGVCAAMLAGEIRRIKQPAIKRKLKKVVYDAVYDAQTADSESHNQEPNVRYFVLQSDGSVAEVQGIQSASTSGN